MDEDEEIIFEGHPLYNHLQETCNQEFEYVPKKLIQNNQHVSNLKKSHYEGFTGSLLKTLLINGIQKCITIFSSPKLVADNLILSSLKLLQYGILPEDVSVLENISSINEILLHRNTQERKNFKKDLIAKYQLNWTDEVLLLELGVICSLLMTLWFLSIIYPNLSAILLFIVLAVTGLRVFARWKFSQNQCRIDSFVEISHNLFKSCSKSQKILNEINFLGKEDNLKFLTSTHNALYTAQEDVTEAFIAFLTRGHLRLKQMGGHLNFSPISSLYDDRFSDMTNFVKIASHTPLSSIKVKREILSQRYSGFVTEFILLTEASNGFGIGWSTEPTSIFCDWQLQRMKSMVDLLHKCITLANHAWFLNDDGHTLSEVVIKDGKLTRSLCVAGSLSTRAKAFLASFYRFEELLRNACDNADILDEVDAVTTDIEYCRDQMATELESCSGCLDEIKTILTTETSSPPVQPSIVEPIPIDVTQNPTIGGSEPIIMDEVFELYVTACDDADFVGRHDVIEDRETIKAQKNRCQNVLKEMRPILNKRRTMWERREEIALRRTANEKPAAANEASQASLDKVNQNIERDDKEVDTAIVCTPGDKSNHLTKEQKSSNDRDDNFIDNDNHLIRECTSSIDSGDKTIVSDNFVTKPLTILIDRKENVDHTEQIFEGDGEPQTLEERIASWNGNVGLGLMSVLAGSTGKPLPFCSEEIFDAIGEQELDSETDSSSDS